LPTFILHTRHECTLHEGKATPLAEMGLTAHTFNMKTK